VSNYHCVQSILCSQLQRAKRLLQAPLLLRSSTQLYRFRFMYVCVIVVYRTEFAVAVARTFKWLSNTALYVKAIIKLHDTLLLCAWTLVLISCNRVLHRRILTHCTYTASQLPICCCVCVANSWACERLTCSDVSATSDEALCEVIRARLAPHGRVSFAEVARYVTLIYYLMHVHETYLS
jgi:hypothetical protein